MEGSIPDFFCTSFHMNILTADCEGILHQVDCSCCTNCNVDEDASIESLIPGEKTEENDEPIEELVNVMKESEIGINAINAESFEGDDDPTEEIMQVLQESGMGINEIENEDIDVMRQYPIYSSTTDMQYALSRFSPRVGDPDSPQEEAYEWLISEGNLSINADSPNLFQRYVLALLYFEMDGDSWPYRNWLSKKKSECNFPGVGCNDNSEVISITLGKTTFALFINKT